MQNNEPIWFNKEEPNTIEINLDNTPNNSV